MLTGRTNSPRIDYHLKFDPNDANNLITGEIPAEKDSLHLFYDIVANHSTGLYKGIYSSNTNDAEHIYLVRSPGDPRVINIYLKSSISGWGSSITKQLLGRYKYYTN